MSIHSIEIFIFLFGLCIGSFLNVCIYRLPVSGSIMKPARSMCLNCNSIIKFYDNIPVLSYLWLRAKCRKCGHPISFRYPMIEITSGFAALCVFIKFGTTFEGLVYYGFISSLLVITFIDIDHRIIPDVITLAGIPVFFLTAMGIPELGLKNSFIGILAGGGSLFLVALVYNLITKKEGMGGGDIKLLAMIGALTGWQGVLFTIFLSSLIGTLSGLIIMMRTQKGMNIAVPFGPFLSIGAITYVFFGRQIIQWYFGMLS